MIPSPKPTRCLLNNMVEAYRAMTRKPETLASDYYDLVVVGGGVFGICAAWDAVLRGLKVALIERRDFAHATSASCYKMVHGGMRYLQHGDLVRLRESSRERSILLRLAPHLVEPLPIVVPTSGHGKNSRGLLRVAMSVYDLLTMDRNRGIVDPDRRIPPAKSMSRAQVLEHFPGLEDSELTGAVLFCDAQMYSPPRLAMAFLRAAVSFGLEAANYVEAIGFRRSNGSIEAVEVRDILDGGEFEIRGRAFINAAGPWCERLLSRTLGSALSPATTFSRDAFFVVPRRLKSPYTLALQARNRDPDALLSREARHLFVAPWRDCNIIGVWHLVSKEDPDSVDVSNHDLEQFIEEVNEAYPALGLEVSDVALWSAGLVVFGDNQSDTRDLSYGKRSRLVDHAVTHHVDNLVSLMGVRYTMARRDAERAVDMVVGKLGIATGKCRTACAGIYGGGFDSFRGLLEEARARYPDWPEKSLDALVRNHGVAYDRVLKASASPGRDPSLLDGTDVTKAEIVYAGREEMVSKLSDVVFRRTDLGTGGHPGQRALEEAGWILGREKGWSDGRIKQEIEETGKIFANHAAK